MSNPETLLFSLAGVLFLGLLAALYINRANAARQKVQKEVDAMSLFAVFERECNDFRLRVHVMDEHLSEYTSVFQEAGWSSIISTMHSLDTLQDILSKIAAKRDFLEVTHIIKSLNGEPERCEEVTTRGAQEAIRALEDWRAKTRNIFINLIDNLQKEALRTQELGVTRPRKRQPTLTAIQTLRESLGIYL